MTKITGAKDAQNAAEAWAEAKGNAESLKATGANYLADDAMLNVVKHRAAFKTALSKLTTEIATLTARLDGATTAMDLAAQRLSTLISTATPNASVQIPATVIEDIASDLRDAQAAARMPAPQEPRNA